VPSGVGQRVRVRGRLQEQAGLTTLEADQVLLCGLDALPPVARVRADEAEFERFEGMRVQFASPLVVTDSFSWSTGTVMLSSPSRLFAPRPGASPVIQLRLGLDVLGSDGPGAPPRLGDRLQVAEGVLSQRGEDYWLEPAVRPAFVVDNPRPPLPPEVGGEVRLASFNLENYFVELGGRGAESADQLERQRQKLTQALSALDADVIALVELENSGSRALDDLVVALNASQNDSYERVAEPTYPGTDAIRVGLIYRPSRVSLLADSARSDGDPVHRRPPQAQGFTRAGENFAVIVTHAKSKSCQGASGLERDFGDGCFGAERVRQAQALLRFVDDVRVAAATSRVVVVGDFNALPGEQSLLLFEAAGLVPELETRLALHDRYSYVFKGEAGLLDHAFTTPELSTGVTGAGVWHINADEAATLGYAGEIDEPGPFRSSDHDPIVLGFSLGK